jgi:c-di-GMP phosphodiesterase
MTVFGVKPWGVCQMDIYVARQPIFRRDKSRFGYELLFRDGLSQAFPGIDGTKATSRVLSTGFLSIGIENVTGKGMAFVNFTRDMLVQRVPMMFPKERLVVEVLEDVEPDEEVVQACLEMSENGYRIALDDFLYRPELAALIGIAAIIKFDLSVTPLETLPPTIKRLAPYRVELLAERVETHEQFRQALEMGFTYFQGYFFSRPEILKGREISGLRVNLLRTMAEVNRSDVDYSVLEKIIRRDVGISYKLLRFINSAYFRPLCEITSIRQAIAMLGERGLRRFISLISMTGLGSGKPDELVRESIVRACFCEGLGEITCLKEDRSRLFTLGLFSLIDALMDDRMETLMENLPLSGDIKTALVQGEGPLGTYLRLVESYQKGAWGEVLERSRSLGVAEDRLPACFLNSLALAETMSDL